MYMYNVTVTPFTYPITQYVCLCFAVTMEDLQVQWKSVHTRFEKLTGYRSGDGAHELMDRDKYILEKLQFLERHIVHVPSWQTSTVSTKLKMSLYLLLVKKQ